VPKKKGGEDASVDTRDVVGLSLPRVRKLSCARAGKRGRLLPTRKDGRASPERTARSRPLPAEQKPPWVADELTKVDRMEETEFAYMGERGHSWREREKPSSFRPPKKRVSALLKLEGGESDDECAGWGGGGGEGVKDIICRRKRTEAGGKDGPLKRDSRHLLRGKREAGCLYTFGSG